MRAPLIQLLLAFAATMFAAAPSSADAPAPPSAEARAAWGFDRSDLPPHPGVRFGVLANGMRYALMRNAAPPGALSVRLHFDAGASVEAEGELGFMHLLEHLIFHGTPNIPEGSLPLMMAHRGMRRLTDFNAFTSYDETVYRLDMARSDAAARDAALMLMREIAGNLVFDRRTVEGAKKKVREEIRGRDEIKDRIAAAQNAFFVPGTRLARGPVAGSVRSVGRAKGASLRRLYDLYYRPERATLVVVGDFDPAAAEAELAARFSDWREGGKGAASPRPPLALGSAPSSGIRLFVDRRAPTAVTIASIAPLGGLADASAPRDRHFLEHLGVQMLNRRLARLAKGPDAPFVSAAAAIYDHFSTARIASLDVTARDSGWRQALEAGADELERALSGGFSEEELKEQIAHSRRSLGAAAAPPTTHALADAIVDAVGRRIVFTAPADPSATAAYLGRIRLADLNAAFRAAWPRSKRLVLLSHNRRVPEAEIAAAAGISPQSNGSPHQP